MSLVEWLLNNLKNREASPRDWKQFTQKDGYIVAKGNKIFEILSEITSRSSEKNANLSLKELPNFSKSKIKMKIQYEEEKGKNSLTSTQVDSSGFFEGFLSDEKVSSRLTNVTQRNIKIWKEILSDAVKDLISKSNNKLMLEELLSAFETLNWINEMIVKEVLLNRAQGKGISLY